MFLQLRLQAIFISGQLFFAFCAYLSLKTMMAYLLTNDKMPLSYPQILFHSGVLSLLYVLVPILIYKKISVSTPIYFSIVSFFLAAFTIFFINVFFMVFGEARKEKSLPENFRAWRLIPLGIGYGLSSVTLIITAANIVSWTLSLIV